MRQKQTKIVQVEHEILALVLNLVSNFKKLLNFSLVLQSFLQELPFIPRKFYHFCMFYLSHPRAFHLLERATNLCMFWEIVEVLLKLFADFQLLYKADSSFLSTAVLLHQLPIVTFLELVMLIHSRVVNLRFKVSHLQRLCLLLLLFLSIFEYGGTHT